MADPIPYGVQPMTDTHILCLECGRWLRALSAHLSLAHGTDTAAYRQAHGLRVNLALSSPAVSARLSESTTIQVRQDPRLAAHVEEAVRDAGRARREGRAAKAAKRAYVERGGRREQHRREHAERTAARNAAVGAESLARMERWARSRGHESLVAYFAVGEPDRVIAAGVGLSSVRVATIRIGMGVRRRGPGAPVVAKPVRASRVVVCVDCGAVVEVPAGAGWPPERCPACALVHRRAYWRVRAAGRRPDTTT